MTAGAHTVTRCCTSAPGRWWATGTALAVGILKERYDSHHGGWRDPADAAYTVAGGFVFGCAVYRSDPDQPKRFATAPKLEPTAKDLRDLHSTTKEVP